MKTIYLVIPCYQEEAALPQSAARLREKLDALMESGKISPQSRIVFVDDGSKDRTWELIRTLHAQDPRMQGIHLSRNRGHQNALLAGLMTVKSRCDAAISLDADLQDDIDVLDRMIEQLESGIDIVYGVRSDRQSDSFFKRSTAQGFYKLMNHIGVELIYNHADYRLMSRRALDALEEYREVNLFLRGIVPMIGYPSATVSYERHERQAGESKYPLKKMLAFAMEGVNSLSVKPIRLITTLGVSIFGVSILMLVYFLVRYFTGHTITGWTSLALSVWAIGGLQLLAIVVIG